MQYDTFQSSGFIELLFLDFYSLINKRRIQWGVRFRRSQKNKFSCNAATGYLGI
jgi:hypothetical protein